MSAPSVVEDNAPIESYDDNTERQVNAPGDDVPEESVKGNEVKGGDLDGISEDNIIEGERSTRASNFTADDELDQKVEEVSAADPGMA
ncbi:hypothetical protein ACM66B_003103 [Microbotryomycetes sp. NB124-2]